MGQSRLRMSPTYFHVLLALSEGRKHGYAIMREFEERTRGRVTLGPSSLYYSLGRLLEAGLIAESEGQAGRRDGGSDEPHEERRRYYELTAEGRKRLESESVILADIVAHARAMGIVGER